MFRLLTARVTVSVLLLSFQRVPVVLFLALWREVREEGVVRVGVRLVEVAGGGRSRVGLMRMEKLMLFVFAVLVPLLAARALLRFGRGRNPFVTRILGALPTSPAAVRLSAARAKRVTRGCPGQRRKAARGGEQRRLGRKASQVEVICEEKNGKRGLKQVVLTVAVRQFGDHSHPDTNTHLFEFHRSGAVHRDHCYGDPVDL